MKKIYLVLLVCSSIITSAQSSKREEGIKIGIKAGINFSNFNGDVPDNNLMRNGLHFGVLSEIIVSDKFSFQPELLYSAQGFKDDTPGLSSKNRYDYINIPLMVKYYAYNNLSVEFGPQVGFLINADNRSNAGNADIPDQNIVDFGMNLGLGYELPNGIFFQGRYNLGITNVNGASNNDQIKYTNSVFQLSVGVFF